MLRKEIIIFWGEFMAKAETTIKGRDLRLEVPLTRFGASRNRHGDVACLIFAALHKHLVVDVTVTSARTNSSVPVVWAPLRALGGLAMGAQQAKLDVDFRTLFSLGTPSIYYDHNY
jgi:hypothetical protein